MATFLFNGLWEKILINISSQSVNWYNFFFFQGILTGSIKGFKLYIPFIPFASDIPFPRIYPKVLRDTELETKIYPLELLSQRNLWNWKFKQPSCLKVVDMLKQIMEESNNVEKLSSKQKFLFFFFLPHTRPVGFQFPNHLNPGHSSESTEL